MKARPPGFLLCLLAGGFVEKILRHVVPQNDTERGKPGRFSLLWNALRTIVNRAPGKAVRLFRGEDEHRSDRIFLLAGK